VTGLIVIVRKLVNDTHTCTHTDSQTLTEFDSPEGSCLIVVLTLLLISRSSDLYRVVVSTVRYNKRHHITCTL